MLAARTHKDALSGQKKSEGDSEPRRERHRRPRTYRLNVHHPRSDSAPASTSSIFLKSSYPSQKYKLLKEREDLIRSNQDLEHFAFLAAHDLKSPLQTAISWLHYLHSEIQCQHICSLEKPLEIIEKNLTKSISYVNDLLNLAKLNKAPQTLAECDLNQVLNDSIRLHEDAIRESKGIIIRHDLPKIIANKSQLECVFSNLIQNATKYRATQRILKIEISVVERADSYEFSFEDNGTGIPQEKLRDIFNLYETGETGIIDSTGIGLTYCKKVIRLHGGDIWAESVLGQGSTIKFTLPKMS